MQHRIRASQNERRRSDPVSESVRPAPAAQPLPAAVRAATEPLLGHDFADVMVHADASADSLAAEYDARAFTVGSDIYFRDGLFAPDTSRGMHLVAHELAHVAQNTGGASQAGLHDVSQPHDSAERDASRAADSVMAGRAFAVESAPGAVVAREAEGDEEHESIFSTLGGMAEWPSKIAGIGEGVLSPVSNTLGAVGNLQKTFGGGGAPGAASGILGLGGNISSLVKTIGEETMGEKAAGGFGAGGSFLGAASSAVDAVGDVRKGNYGKAGLEALKSVGGGLSGAAELGGFNLMGEGAAGVANAGIMDAGSALAGEGLSGAAAAGPWGALIGSGLAGYEAGSMLNEHTSVGKHTENAMSALDTGMTWLDNIGGGKESSWFDKTNTNMSNEFKNFDIMGGVGDALKLGAFSGAGAIGGLAGGALDAHDYVSGKISGAENWLTNKLNPFK